MNLNPRRAVSRARGRALRAVGVPRTPNLPSARTIARRVYGIQRPAARRQHVQDDDSTSVRPPDANRRDDRTGNPYDDPSRDVGEGPDHVTRMQGAVLLAGALVGVYLLSATCGTGVVSDQRPVEHCHTMCSYERGDYR